MMHRARAFTGSLPSATAQRFGARGTDQGEETVDARP